jgi:hypothetical protein
MTVPRVTALCLGLSLLATSRADACRCREPAVGAAHRRAELVVMAKVLEVKPRASDPQGQEAKVQVLDAWKKDTAQTITVTTGTDCAYPLTVGDRHLLFLTSAGDGLTTGRCMGNLPAARAQRAVTWLSHHGKRGVVGP